MKGAAEFNFALYVDDVALAHTDEACDPVGTAEGDLTEFVHSQTIDLPDDFAFGVNHDGAALDLFGHTLLNAVGTLDFRHDGLFDVVAADDV